MCSSAASRWRRDRSGWSPWTVAVRVRGSISTDRERSTRLTTRFASVLSVADQEMLLPDVNVLVYAHRKDSIPDHAQYAQWLVRLATGPEPFAISVLVLSGFVRVATNARAFARPSTLDEVFAFVAELVDRPHRRSRSRPPHDLRTALP